jgi:hypothetical protein
LMIPRPRRDERETWRLADFQNTARTLPPLARAGQRNGTGFLKKQASLPASYLGRSRLDTRLVRKKGFECREPRGVGFV